MNTSKLITLKGVKINFNLRQLIPANKPTSIHCILRYNKFKVVVYDIEKVEPRYWNSKNQTSRSNQRNHEGIYLNDILKERAKTFDLLFSNYIDKHKSYPEPAEFKELCLKSINKESQLPEKPITDLLSFFELFITETETGKRLNNGTGKPLSKVTIRIYKMVKNVLAQFKEAKKHNLTFENITLDFYEDFIDYLKFHKQFSTNTLGKYIKTIKTVLGDAKERGYTDVEHFKSKRFKVLTEETDTVYLNTSELESMFKLDLSNSPRLERVRDLFMVGCWSGLRFSDYNDISPKNIFGEYLKIRAIKTGKEVVIPIHDTIKAIMLKYQDKTENSLPPRISNPKMNEYIKEVANLAKINETIETRFTKAGKVVFKNVPKNQLITTHTARRSFATNMYLMGIPTITIMAITGHRTESSFMKYIKVTPDEHAVSMMNLWRRNNIKAV